MSRQDKATTERHAKTLREILKKPENKFCADCKRNDPRWASWNLGVFLCIRCSGIHRSMGTHISKVKSVDLDMWTPEQMASVQKWGNRLANLYWEAHLKAGHVPPEHKMDSFIRSKYESRRWALEGPPPSDPSVLDSGVTESPAPAPAPAPAAPSHSTRPTHASTPSTSSLRSPINTRQPQPHQLLSANIAGRATAVATQAVSTQPAVVPPPQQQQPQPAPAPADDLFTLDFHSPAASSASTNSAPAQKKDTKQDILSLFAARPAAAPAAPFGQFGVGTTAAQPQAGVGWGAAPAPQAPPQQTSMMGNAGAGMWGASSGWNAPPPTGVPAQQSLWAQPAAQPQVQQQSLFNTSDIWASPGAGAGADPFASTAGAGVQKKENDVFGDIWGGFK